MVEWLSCQVYSEDATSGGRRLQHFNSQLSATQQAQQSSTFRVRGTIMTNLWKPLKAIIQPTSRSSQVSRINIPNPARNCSRLRVSRSHWTVNCVMAKGAFNGTVALWAPRKLEPSIFLEASKITVRTISGSSSMWSNLHQGCIRIYPNDSLFPPSLWPDR